MSLDARARHAVRSLQEGVSRVTPVALPVVTRRHRVSAIAGLVGALALAFGSIALAAMLPEPAPSDTATNSIPEFPDGDLVALPEHGDIPEGVHQSNATSDSIEPYTRFYGTATPGTVIVATSPYGSADTVANEAGEFSFKLWFEGAPTGETFAVTLTVGDEVFEFEFTWLWDPEGIDITAHQAYGASDSATPYEKFFGTAPPGTEVVATSPYGGGQTAAGDGGEWLLKVWFEGPPVNEPFEITVTVGDQVFTFPFIWYGNIAEQIEVTQIGTSSDSPNPYTRFVGHAPAGTHILAMSEYGSADLEVGESGEFDLKVWFSDAPAGETFPITLKVNHEYFQTFHFTWYYEAGPVEFSLHQYNTESESPDPWVKFYGTATPGTTIALYSSYGSADLEVGASGEWLLKLWFEPLPPAGEQFPITVKVNGAFYGTFYFTSWYQPGEGGFTLHQYNTESDGPEPWVKFYGTGAPGTTVALFSSYGSADLAVGESGEWMLVLNFSPLPPAGEQFPITVKVNGAFYGTFYFTSWYQEATPITAYHAYSESSEAEPFDDLWGTAPAGSLIKIMSPYNATQEFTVGESGSWERRVYFVGAPYGTAFQVTVKVNGSPVLVYWFTVNQPV